MRRKTIGVVDDQLYANVATDSSAELNVILGKADQLAIHAIATDVLSGGTNNVVLDLFVFGSADGQNWIQRNGNPTTAGNGDISLSWSPSTNAQSGHMMWSDGAVQQGGTTNGVGPLLPYIRIHVHVVFGAMYLRVFATFRDQG